MRYYHEPGQQEKKQDTKENIYEIRTRGRTSDSLVIEEDTVYEIDEVCMRQRNVRDYTR